MLKVCPLGSGSKGNCIYTEFGGVGLLLDAGLSFSDIKKRLFAAGVGLRDISGVLVTHEHSDHINGLSGFVKSGVPIFVHERAAEFIGNKFRGLSIRKIRDEAFDFFGIRITPFGIPHDAAYPLGFRLTDGNAVVSAATDVGHISGEVVEGLFDSDILVVEANYDENMLRGGRYPERLKRRIVGGGGHLDNSAAAELLKRVITPRTKKVLLAHLSEENNLPELAFDTVAKALKKCGIEAEKDIKIEVLKQGEKGSVYSVGKLR
ncbi:MAG: MBL fold metallo-hydrolase [Clostridiales bacterium]|jgi:phosphoribosyl 1,2-cyclic phosphodiesterase|nr:MBL fold metallo-hydrolase [Clostridiales bacterium]